MGWSTCQGRKIWLTQRLATSLLSSSSTAQGSQSAWLTTASNAPKRDWKKRRPNWEKRYKTGGNSGAGSYARSAAYTADVINTYVAKHHVTHVIELGFGDGNQLSLGKYPRYTGVDVSATITEKTRKKFEHDPSKEFIHYDGRVLPKRARSLSLSLS